MVLVEVVTSGRVSGRADGFAGRRYGLAVLRILTDRHARKQFLITVGFVVAGGLIGAGLFWVVLATMADVAADRG